MRCDIPCSLSTVSDQWWSFLQVIADICWTRGFSLFFTFRHIILFLEGIDWVEIPCRRMGGCFHSLILPWCRGTVMKSLPPSNSGLRKSHKFQCRLNMHMCVKSWKPRWSMIKDVDEKRENIRSKHKCGFYREQHSVGWRAKSAAQFATYRCLKGVVTIKYTTRRMKLYLYKNTVPGTLLIWLLFQ